MDKRIDSCDICFKIKCKKCGWEPAEAEVQQVMNKELTNCPDCGWNPSS